MGEVSGNQYVSSNNKPMWLNDKESVELLKAAWAFFDKIYCINLNSRPDRKETCDEIFKMYNIPISFYQVDRHPVSGLQGCFESHVDIITKSYEAGYNNILIFEDDLLDSPYFTSELLSRAVHFMNTDDKWELFYLGTHLDIYSNKVKFVSPYILKVKSFTTHAYALSRKGMERYAYMKYKNVPYDFLTVRNPEAYAIYPGLFYQNGSESDINLVDFPMMSWIKRNWYFLAENYAYNVNIPLYYVAIIGLVIVVTLMMIYYGQPEEPVLFVAVGLLVALILLFLI